MLGRVVLPLAVAGALAVAGPAAAATLCVGAPPSTSCDATYASLQPALNAADANNADDTVVLGAGTFAGAAYPEGADPANQDGAHDVAIVGQGPAATILTSSTAGSVLRVYNLGGGTYSVASVGMVLDGTASNGLYLNGTASHVAISEAPTVHGVGARSGAIVAGSIDHSTIDAPDAVPGLFLLDGGASDVAVRADIAVRTGAAIGESVSFDRMRIAGATIGFQLQNGDATLSDSLVDMGANAFGTGISVEPPQAYDTALTGHRLTLVGSGTGQEGVRVTAVGGQSGVGVWHALATLDDTIISGYDVPIARVTQGTGSTAGYAHADVVTDYDDDPGTGYVDTNDATGTGTGTITQTHHLTVAPDFVSATDFDLADGSPLRDAGDPAFASPSGLDLSGAARMFGGRLDVGALEWHPAPPADDGGGGGGGAGGGGDTTSTPTTTTTSTTATTATPPPVAPPASPTPAPAAPRPAALKIVLPEGGLAVGRSGAASLTLQNPNAAAVQATVTLTVPGATAKAKPVVVGTRAIAIAAGRRLVVRVTLTAKGQALLKRKRRLAATVRVTGAKVPASARTVTLKRG